MNESFDELTRGIRDWGTSALDNVGIVITMSKIPEYVIYAALRDELELMHPIRRWLSFRKRRKAQRLKLRAQVALINKVLEAGKS